MAQQGFSPTDTTISPFTPKQAPRDTGVLSEAMGTKDPFSMTATTKTPVQVPKYVGLKVPDIEKQMTERKEVLRPGREEELRITKELGTFEGATAKNQAEARLMEAEGSSRAQRQYADAMKMEQLDNKRKELEAQMEKPFIPTQDTAQDIAGLFSLINVVGFAIGAGGKMNAQAALSAMNGMLDGHMKGRKDLYDREKGVFEENLKVLKNRWDMLKNDMERAAQLAQVNLQAATAEAKTAAARHGATFINDNIDKFGLMRTLEYVREGNKAAEKAYDTALKHKQDVEVKNAEMVNAFNREVYRAQTSGQGGARASAINSRLAYIIQNSFLQAGQDLINAARHPSQSLGAFAGLTGADSKGILDAVKKVGTRNLTDADQRTYEQIISGLEAHMARVMGGGYATSATKAQMDMYKTQIPRSGDPAVVGLMFLARMKQELGLELHGFASHPGATEDQVRNMANVYSQVDSLIPFNVNQVQQAIGESTDLQKALSATKKWTDKEQKRLDELERKAGKEREEY